LTGGVATFIYSNQEESVEEDTSAEPSTTVETEAPAAEAPSAASPPATSSEEPPTSEASESAPAASESAASESAPAASESAPAASESAPAATGEAEGASSSASEEGGGADPHLIGLCVVMWLVALVILGARWSTIKVDYYLGNIKETLGPLEAAPKIDEESVQALVDMADSEEVVEALRGELDNPTQIDQRYRAMMVLIADRIGDDEAFAFLADRAAADFDFRVRANAYQALAGHGEAGPPERRERSFQVLHAALLRETDPIAQAVAIESVGRLRDQRAAWDVIKLFRDAEGETAPLTRARCLGALLAISGQEAEAMQADHAAEGEALDAQVQAWETWFQGAGGTIPAGESQAEVRAAQAEAPSEAPGASGEGGETPEPPSQSDEKAGSE
jgi:hypothetical protein